MKSLAIQIINQINPVKINVRFLIYIMNLSSFDESEKILGCKNDDLRKTESNRHVFLIADLKLKNHHITYKAKQKLIKRSKKRILLTRSV